MSSFDEFMDILHDIGRCGCDKCTVDPDISVKKNSKNKNITLEFELPDRRVAVAGKDTNEVFRNAIKSINMKAGV